MKATLYIILAAIILLSSQFAVYLLLGGEHPLGGYTQPQVEHVFSKIRKAALHRPQHVNKNVTITVHVGIIENSTFNAYVRESEIKNNHQTVFVVVTRGLLNFLNSEDELAAVLGHEWGHYISGDTNGSWVPKDSETMADFAGIFMAERAGYDSCYIGHTWGRILDEYGDGESQTHPRTSTRHLMLTCPLKIHNQAYELFLFVNKKIHNGIKYLGQKTPKIFIGG